MEAKDVALLGFVSAAQKYVDKNLGRKESLGDLENIDIKKLKDELSKELKLLALSDDYKKELTKVGEKAFDEYAKENLGYKKSSIIDELGEIFKVDFDEPTKEEEETKKEINDLLEAYDLDEKVSVVSEVKTNENDDLDLDAVDEFGLSDNDDVLLTIANAAAKSDEELAQTFENKEIKKPENMDSVYNEVVNNEEIKEEVKEEEPVVRKKLSEELASNKKYEEPVFRQTNPQPVSAPSGKLSDLLKANKDYVAPKVEPVVKKETVTSNGPLSQTLREIGKPSIHYTKEQEEIRKQNVFIPNPGIDIVLKQEQEEDNYYNLEQEEDQHSFNEVVENPAVDEDADPTLSEVLAGLGKLQRKQEQKAVVEKDSQEEIYASIMSAYPYLTKEFIKGAYAQKQEIKNEYHDNNKYILLHRLAFNNIDELHEFVEIMMAHDYSVNVDEKKMIVDTFKTIINTDGSILANILGIANQGNILNGNYEGYRVIEQEA